MKAYRSLLRHAERSRAALDIGLTDFVILEMLLTKGPQKAGSIARRIGLTGGAITSAIDGCEAQGLVVRAFDAEDRRARIVELTPRGRGVIERAFARHAAAMDDATGALSAAELRTLAALLERLGTAAAEAKLATPD